MSGWRRSACGFCVAVGFAAGLPAQQLAVVHRDQDQQLCTVQVTAFGGSGKPGGAGWLVVDAQNHDARPHALAVQFASAQWADHAVQIDRSVALGPQERSRFWLPLPNGARPDLLARVQIDATAYHEMVRTSAPGGVVGLLLSDRPQQQAVVLAALQAVASAEKPEVVVCSSPDAPPDWRLFTGFEIVLVDGRCQLRAEAQDALRRYVHAGGQVLVAGPANLPAGPVRDALAALALPGAERHGLGTWLAADRLEDAAVQELLGALPRLGMGLWPLPEALGFEQDVPGLGRAPVLVFLSVILLFAVLVGPVNFVLLRRWRRPLLALVTVPALGFGTTLLMLGYGALHDGFGVRGTVRSWTLLDQQRHEATTVVARTLFAGLSPGSLALGGDTLLLARDAFAPRWQRRAHRWTFDADRGLLEGGLLPSRTMTPLVSVQQAVVRERLQVRSSGESLEVLADGGIEPQGEMLVRLPDGSFWTGTAPHLRPCDPETAARVFDGLLRAAGSHATLTPEDPGRQSVYVRGTSDERRLHNLEALTTPLCGARELSRGTWFARVARTPWTGDHGLQIAYDRREHFVVGRFAAEDVLR